MPVHRGQGQRRPEPPRYDKIPQGVPARKAETNGAPQRGPDGKFLPGNALASKGGKRRAGSRKHLHQLGLEWLDGKPELSAARKRGNLQLKAEQQWVAQSVGAGVLDPLAAAELRNAVSKEVLGQLLMENPKMLGSLRETINMADKLLTGARGHRLTAIELAARGAESRQGGAGRALDIGSIDVSAELEQLKGLLGSKNDEGASDD